MYQQRSCLRGWESSAVDGHQVPTYNAGGKKLTPVNDEGLSLIPVYLPNSPRITARLLTTFSSGVVFLEPAGMVEIFHLWSSQG